MAINSAEKHQIFIINKKNIKIRSIILVSFVSLRPFKNTIFSASKLWKKKHVEFVRSTKSLIKIHSGPIPLLYKPIFDRVILENAYFLGNHNHFSFSNIHSFSIFLNNTCLIQFYVIYLFFFFFKILSKIQQLKWVNES